MRALGMQALLRLYLPARHAASATKHIRVSTAFGTTQLLNEYVGEFGTISNRRQNGLCRRHHAMVAQAIKRSRHMGAFGIDPCGHCADFQKG